MSMERKKNIQRWKRGVVVALLLFLCVPTMVMYADTEETTDYPEKEQSPSKETVKVGYYENDVFQVGTSDEEEKSGYGYEYLQKVASIAGWEYEYVYGSWNEVYTMFINGEVDVLAGVGYSKEREEVMNYPAYSMGSDDYYLYCNNEEQELSNDLTKLNGKKIGTLSGLMKGVLEDWMEKNEIDAEVVVYDEVSERDEDLEQGNITAMIAEIFYSDTTSTLSPVISIGENEMYLCVTKERTDLLEQLNKALAEINISSPYYTQELAQKYLKQNAVGLALSNRETQWLEEHDNEIVIGYLNNVLPLSDTDEEGNVTGLISNLMEGIVRELGIEEDVTITYQGYDDGHDIMKDLGEQKIDVAFPVGDHTWYLEQYDIFHSDDIISSSMNLVELERDTVEAPESLAVNKNDVIQEEITKMAYPDATIKYYASIEECLDAVLNQKVDATYLNNYSVNGYINRMRYHKLQVAPMTEENAICFGVGSDNSALLALLDRGINALDDDYVVNATYKYEGDYYKTTLLDVLQEHMVATIVTLIVIVGIFVWLMAVIIYKTASQKKLDYIAHRDAMTGLLNRRAYEEKIKDLEKQPVSDKQGYFSIDVNGLKQANDTLGHEAGDELIKAAAQCMKKAFDTYGDIYRTGGDEFVVLYKADDKTTAKAVETLQQAVAEWKGEFCSELSLAIGYVKQVETEEQSIISAARIADERMYEEKAKHYASVKYDRRRG
ncbi:transporter substrate-binding domain-containing diguanylate cyclase [Eubacterium oxidoreducens]|uniref:Diguanylate cyclase (GGDEF) domain-containing protein n=1 Tax=Eubacterium oxidoreducens TaxID=1732 RepID=A0A1G6AE19_EUBOX|nr:transporter substrate-binding domain-containing protein [Eubacterium oxidoreducens]SDB06645.1 diguanylate cyclase (GGDEF) domain-containing protein [Eubacterium oxidoreducens]